MSKPFLEVRDLAVHYPMRRGLLLAGPGRVVKAVDGVSLDVARGEILGLVGESGCGKSTLARAILQLTPVAAGTVRLGGRTLSELGRDELRRARSGMQMVFQDPYGSLNPRMTVFDTLVEALTAHRSIAASELAGKVADLMARVGLSAPFARRYPHEFSGGQRQRIAIARALAVEPGLIVADEPVSALDVSIQAQIVNLLGRLCRELSLALVFISHDLAVVRHIADRIAVMYLGRMVEQGPAAAVFDAPKHPYTRALVSAIPLPDPDRERARERIVLRGDPPSPAQPPSGCPFHPRCPMAVGACSREVPVLRSVGEREVACPLV